MNALVGAAGSHRPAWFGVIREATTDMANNPKKIVDPTEAALSAIQEALKVRDDEDQPDHRAANIPEPLGSVDDEQWHDHEPAPSPNFFEPEEVGAPAGDQ